MFGTLPPDREAVGFVSGEESNLQVRPQGLDDGGEMVHAIHSATSFLFVRPRESHQMLTGINPGWQLPTCVRSRDTSCRSPVTLYDEESMGGKKKTLCPLVVPLMSTEMGEVRR